MQVGSDAVGTTGDGRRNEVGTGALTAAELRVLVFLPTHLPLGAVADRLHVSRDTVKSHVRAIYRKFGVGDRCAAVAHAVRVGLVVDVTPRSAPPVPPAGSPQGPRHRPKPTSSRGG